MVSDARYDWRLVLYNAKEEIVGEIIEEKNAYSCRPTDIIISAAKLFPSITHFTVAGKMVRS